MRLTSLPPLKQKSIRRCTTSSPYTEPKAPGKDASIDTVLTLISALVGDNDGNSFYTHLRILEYVADTNDYDKKIWGILSEYVFWPLSSHGRDDRCNYELRGLEGSELHRHIPLLGTSRNFHLMKATLHQPLQPQLMETGRNHHSPSGDRKRIPSLLESKVVVYHMSQCKKASGVSVES
jgi:hypothetical protein